ncbi:MAG TPA: M24 family metallopeptidase [Dehalococcoidia bacterium]|nr:M24 family metallopeptidase [Dehalococcoidia bacterium]
MQIPEIQRLLAERGLDGWLFCDFRRSNPIAYQALGLRTQIVTRRWYYFAPAQGEPRGLVSALEPHALDGLPGAMRVYRSWQEREAGIAALLDGATRIAAEYSPRNTIPYVSRVDAGTVELLRSLGKEVVSSADLVQYAVARWSEAQLQSHLAASEAIMRAKDHAFAYIGERLRAGATPTDYEVQQIMWADFAADGIEADDPPIVATNANASNPHYLPTADNATPILAGDVVLIDFWGKLRQPDAVYADHTWMAYAGAAVPPRQAEVFAAVAAARDAAIELVRRRMAAGATLHGYEVDDAARAVIEDAGFGEYFVHRTGHSIGEEVHGDGANMDNFESHDERQVLTRTCFSIEPGIYLPEFGVRSEVDLYVHDDGQITVTGGPPQRTMTPLL